MVRGEPGVAESFPSPGWNRSAFIGSSYLNSNLYKVKATTEAPCSKADPDGVDRQRFMLATPSTGGHKVCPPRVSATSIDLGQDNDLDRNESSVQWGHGHRSSNT